MQLTSPAGGREQLERWWRRTLWETPASGRSRARSGLVSVLRAWSHAVTSFDSDLVEMRANALTYRTLLALVPLLAVAFSLFQAFGGLEAGEESLRRMLVVNLGPGSAETAVHYISSFVERVSAGAVAGTGVVFLLFTAVSLLSTIEGSMNALWRIERGRAFLDRFVVYWATLTVGPLLLAVSLSLSSAAQSQAVSEWLAASVPLVLDLGLRLMPWFFSCLSLTLLYVIVPNTHVRWTAALGGGLVAGTLWELAKLAFTWASSTLFSYNAIYGSFGALPAFLLWLQIGWIIVLVGCKMAYVLQHARVLNEERLQIEVGPAGRELLAVAFMTRIARCFTAGEPPPTLSDLVPATRGAINAAQEVVARLEAEQLVRPVPAGERDGVDPEDEAYVPGRDPATITVGQVVSAFRYAGPAPSQLAADEPWMQRACETLDARERATAGIDSTTLAELAGGRGPRGEAASPR